MRYYTGVGSRDTPEWVCKFMSDIAFRLTQEGKEACTLRSGGADGADTAFERGANLFLKDIFLPWNDFNGRRHDGEHYFALDAMPNQEEAFKLAESLHPAWDKLTVGVRKLHARNCYQVLGHDLASPSDFIIYYAVQNKNGEVTGGTRTAVELARRYKIKEYNLFTYAGMKGVINDLW